MDEFLKAAEKGDLSKIKTFIQQNIDVNIQGNDGITALMLAAREGNLEVVKELIASKADIDKANTYGQRALIWAAMYGHLEVVKELIASNADVNVVNSYGNTALMLAAERGHLEVVKELIASNADVNVVNSYGNTALICAASWGHSDVVKELIAKKADIDIADNDGETALIWALRLDKLNVVKELLNSGSDLLLVNTRENAEILVLNKLLSDTNAKSLFDKLPQGNFEGLNSVAKLQLLRAFNFMENNYDKFKEFHSEKLIKEVKASLEAFHPLESLINELTDTSVLDFSTADSRHKLENSIIHLKQILENKNKYESEGIKVNLSKIEEFQDKCKVAAGKKYHELIQSLENIGLKDIFDKYFEENIENGHVDLPNSICAQIYLKLLISNREAKENLSTNEDKVTENLPCATDMIYETYILTSNIEELGSILELSE